MTHYYRPILLLLASALPAAAVELNPSDLPAVTISKVAEHAPIGIVRDGKAKAVIYLADPKPSPNLKRLMEELVDAIRLTTGVTLKRVDQMPADRPVIVVGDCEASRKAGIDATKLPVEGFVIKTVPNRIYLVGSAKPLPAGSNQWATFLNDGTAWAVSDFLERIVDVRWYWPTALGGRAIRPVKSLIVPPLHYRDQPVFRMRTFHPVEGWAIPAKAVHWAKEPLPFAPGAIPKIDGQPVTRVDMTEFLPLIRNGNSFPYMTKPHQPSGFHRDWDRKWSKRPDDLEMFQLRKDGTRYPKMLCYSSDKTLKYLLDGCAAAWDRGEGRAFVTATCVTVSPNDHPISCHCGPCAKTREKGGSPLIMGLFVKRLCEAVAKRWPDKKVIYLPYWNYQGCPEGVDYPDNLEIQLCRTGRPMPLRFHVKHRLEPDTHLIHWSTKARRPIQTWDYPERGPGWVHAPIQYPSFVRDYYRTNRKYVVGSFLNGGRLADWTTSAPTTYYWMRLLWNPDLEWEPVVDQMFKRLYGNAAGTALKLFELQVHRWEMGDGGIPDQGRIKDKPYLIKWPPEVVAEMTALRDKALAQLADDPAGRQRFLYWTWTFDEFVKEAEARQKLR